MSAEFKQLRVALISEEPGLWKIRKFELKESLKKLLCHCPSWCIGHAAARLRVAAGARAGLLAPRADGKGPSIASIGGRKEIWGASLGHSCSNYAFYFVISWLPLYLVKARGLSITQMAEISGLIYVVYATSSFLTGRLSDRWIQSGDSTDRVRKTLILSAHAIMAVSLLVAAIGDLGVSVISLFCAGVAFGVNTPSLFAISQTIAGPQVAGRWIGIQNSVANLAGIVAPIITGFVVDQTGQYYWAFIIAAAVATAGIIGWGLMIGNVGPLNWKAETHGGEATAVDTA